MGRFIGFLILAIVVAGIGYSANYIRPFPWSSGESEEPGSSSPLYADTDESTIHAQGRLEPKGGTISVSGLPGEQIVELLVEVGSPVKQGAELVVLGSKAIREAEVALATARQQQAAAQLASEKALSGPRIEAAQLAVQLAEARQKELPPSELLDVLRKRRDAAVSQLETLKRLRESPATAQAITLAEITQQELLIQQLDAEIQHNQQKNLAAREASELAIKAAQTDLNLARLADTGIAAGDPSGVLDKTLALARLTAAATSVQAPVDGEVLEIFVRPGERIANTPVLLMADLSEMICVAEVHESRLKDLLPESAEPGQLAPREPFSVVIHSDALDAELTGQVVEVGRLIGAPKLRDPNPLARSDVRTAQVKIALDAPSCLVARRFVNLQVDVTIQLKKGADAK